MGNNPNSQYPANTNAPDANYLWGSARNIAVAGDGTGTPWEEDITNDLFGFQQKLLNLAGITPSGSPDTALVSQYHIAMRATAGFPGLIVPMALNVDPATAGIRVLALDGSGILRANYAELDTNVYIGNTANPTADAFFRADNANGTSRNIAGNYLILPDARGRFLRGLDTSGTIDPEGATREIGDEQDWKTYEHYHEINLSGNSGEYYKDYDADNITTGTPGLNILVQQPDGSTRLYAEAMKAIAGYGPIGSNHLSTDEIVPLNIVVNYGIWY